MARVDMYFIAFLPHSCVPSMTMSFVSFLSPFGNWQGSGLSVSSFHTAECSSNCIAFYIMPLFTCIGTASHMDPTLYNQDDMQFLLKQDGHFINCMKSIYVIQNIVQIMYNIRKYYYYNITK